MPPTPKSSATAGPQRRIDWTKFGAGTAPEGDRITWRASVEGDHITGRLGRVTEANTRFGPKALIELDDCRNVEYGGEKAEDGAYLIWPTPALIDEFFASGADEGDLVTVNLVKLIDVGKGSPFKQHEVKVGEPPF